MDNFATILLVVAVIVIIIVINRNNARSVVNSIILKCPRCGYEGAKNTFKGAASPIIGCFLLLLFLIPAIFYYAILGNKVICPKCNNRF